jgi:UDP-N-acetylmuramoylalanine--D-glutamate ligase
MLNNKNCFLEKKILIYGLGKSGLSSYDFLKKDNAIYLFDDKKITIQNVDIKNRIIKIKDIKDTNFDYIILSPGININNCLINKYLLKNLNKIRTDLDIFYSLYSANKNITVTGTNGKSTTAKILYEVLKDQKFDVRLVGNIGNPILLEKNITKNTIFVIEASSYQLQYSKLFKSNISAILNISQDHLERHKTLTNYIKAKFKLVENQTYNDFAFLNIKDKHIKKKLKKTNIISKVIKVNPKINLKILDKINNPYFKSEANRENLSFVIEILNKMNIKKKILIKTLTTFSGLKYRQEIVHKSKNLTIINDSKATTYSSSVSILKSLSNVYWIVGGLAKKGDKFFLSKNKCKTFEAYIFGKNKYIFSKDLKKFMKCQSFTSLTYLIKKIFLDIKNEKIDKDRIILFSPAAASFDSFKNFEDRGKYFNNLIKKLVNVK